MNRKEKIYTYTKQIASVHPEFFNSLSDFASAISNEKRYPLHELQPLRQAIIDGLLVNAGDEFFPVLPDVPTYAKNKKVEPFVRERLQILDRQIVRLQERIALANERETTRKTLFQELFNEFPWVASSISSTTLKKLSDIQLDDAVGKIEEYLFFEKDASTIKMYEARMKQISKELQRRANKAQATLEETGSTIEENVEDLDMSSVSDLKSKVGQYKWYIIGGVALLGGIALLAGRRSGK